jgi:hypothetical protein
LALQIYREVSVNVNQSSGMAGYPEEISLK